MFTQRVTVYIDGFNLYYSMRRKQWYRYYWLDLVRLSRDLINSNQQLVAVKYFSARISKPEHKRRNQQAYLEALETLPLAQIIYGQFKGEDNLCCRCGMSTGLKEKMTDVNISVQMIKDALEDKYDVALLVSGDSDQIPTINAIKELTKGAKRVAVAFPPADFRSKELKAAADYSFKITENKFMRNQLPSEILKKDGYILVRPAKW